MSDKGKQKMSKVQKKYGWIGLVCIGSGTDSFLCSLFFAAPPLLAGSLYLACCYGTTAHTTAQKARKPAKLTIPCNQAA
jgi:hypothetical protein